MIRTTPRCLLIIAGMLAAGSTLADNHLEARIAQARSAAPDAISAEATIMDSDGTILRSLRLLNL